MSSPHSLLKLLFNSLLVYWNKTSLCSCISAKDMQFHRVRRALAICDQSGNSAWWKGDIRDFWAQAKWSPWCDTTWGYIVHYLSSDLCATGIALKNVQLSPSKSCVILLLFFCLKWTESMKANLRVCGSQREPIFSPVYFPNVKTYTLSHSYSYTFPILYKNSWGNLIIVEYIQ